MKNIIILSCFILSTTHVIAQIGISTQLPQKALHISGTVSTKPVSGTSVNIVSPTVRINGLNNTNQSKTEHLHSVSVTDNGDLVLSQTITPIVMIDPINTSNIEKDYIPSAGVINQTAATTTTNAVIRSFDFTLTSPSIVKFNTSTSFKFGKASDGTPITDGSNRTWGTKFSFSKVPSGSPISLNTYFGESVKSYNNVVNSTEVTNGILYTISDDTLYLIPGDYTLAVTLSAATNSAQTPLRITYGGGSDTISIIAYPAQ
ncbi:hypothetical protein [Chryseobacterium shigense]|uniref:DUF4397 domain-containing protein n=1 Tax=Chryseobacterium shigense TaxID=297244 RepID=A0A841NJW7_9FLAO|nr:hypothetical protein [Chryseobacterium shigense]MBB6371095.1 hypothetical protein [Chryseobacterium shigense]